jgi:hypothetical protein
MAERGIPIVIRAIEDSIKQEPIEDGNNEEPKRASPPPLSDTTQGKGHIRPATLVRRKVLSRHRMGTDLDVSIRYKLNGYCPPYGSDGQSTCPIMVLGPGIAFLEFWALKSFFVGDS